MAKQAMTNFHDFLDEQLQDPEIKAEYDALEPEFSLMQAMNEYYAMKEHPEQYKRYASFQDAMKEVLDDA